MRLAFVHIINDNFGDANCCPRLVRPEWAHCPEYDIDDYPRHARPDDVLVIGGGGLLYPKLDAWIRNASRRLPVFVWGVGINYHDGAVPELKPMLEHCVRVTLRHRANKQFPYSPCPSLGRPEFLECMEAPATPAHDMVFYSHMEHLLSRETGMSRVPQLVNSRKALARVGKDDLLSVLRFLASGRVVVTNSYHGVLWSMALDRPVVVWRPFSTRYVYQEPFPRNPDAFVKTAAELKQAVAQLLPQPLPATGHQGFALLREARERVLKEADIVMRTLPRIKVKPSSVPAATGPRDDNDAIAACQKAIEQAPRDAKLRLNLGILLSQQGKHAEAIVHYREALALDPGLVAAHNNLGLALVASGEPDEAIQSYRRAIELDPAYPRAYNNLGTALALRNEPEKAIAIFRKAVELDPLSASAHFNLANCCHIALLLDEAIAHFERGIALAPAAARYHWNYATVLLLKGDYPRGWKEYEWRWGGAVESPGKPRREQPEWNGEDIRGKTILLYCEQGMGDTIQFIRYVPMVAARGARIIVQCHSALAPLLRSVPGIDAFITGKMPPPHYDTHRALLSLPLLFGTTVETIPARVPYLAADKKLAGRWSERQGRSPALKVGIAWGGNEKNRTDGARSCRLEHFAPLAEIPSVRFYSLQKGSYAAQAQSPPAGMNLTDWMDEVKNFADTAALIANLDLVISVDTAVAHLAGALGKPVWLLNRFQSEWRWLLGREDSPWYPTLRNFRQPKPGDWASVLNNVAKSLGELAGKPRKASVSGADIAGDLHPAPAGPKPPDLARIEKQVRQALAKAPTATRHADLAEVLKLQGKRDEAVASYQKAVKLGPKDSRFRMSLGNLLAESGNPATAVVHFDEASRLSPGLVSAHRNLGSCLRTIGKPAEAVRSFRRAIELKPGDAELLLELGSCYLSLNDFDEAARSLREAIRINPESHATHFGLGNACFGQLSLDRAIESFDRAIALAPGFPRYHWNCAMALLLKGDYPRGWKEYEWRWAGASGSMKKPLLKEPEWNGEDISGKAILLYCEQGIGDAIQFIRYAPMVAARGARVIVRCHSPLARLLVGVPGIDAVISGKTPLPRFDTHRALLSLPLLFGTTLETIPARAPYLAADKDLAAAWRTRLGRSPALKVGLVWGGSEKNRTDAARSCRLEQFAPLASIPSVRFYSLQKGSYAAQAKSPPAGMNLTDWMDEVTDFADTAALLANLDLVISVDTAVAHLAGALGKPVWLLNRYESEWRWMLGRDDSPWYPTLRIFQQPQPGNWREPLANVTRQLARLAKPGHGPAGRRRKSRKNK